jgi:excisionase family DNA binding protein
MHGSPTLLPHQDIANRPTSDEVPSAEDGTSLTDVARSTQGFSAFLASLPVEVSTKEAAMILGCSKDTVIKFLQAGSLPFRNNASPGSSKPVYRFPMKDVLGLRTNYARAEPPAPVQEGERRKRIKTAYKFRCLDFDDA